MSVKLEGKEVYCFALMNAFITAVAMYLGVIAARPEPIQVVVAPATPNVQVHVPAAEAPRIDVFATAQPPKVEVMVPAQLPPVVNVAPPPPTTVIVRDERPAAAPAPKPPERPSAPAVAPEPIKAAEAPIRDEELTLDSLYAYAEKYIESYCIKFGLDAKRESERWLDGYMRSLEQSVADGTDSGEQSYINRVVVQKRKCFDIENARPEQIVEGCRLMLRYRDGKLAWLQAMRDAVTAENLKKTLVFLSAGVR